MSGAAVMASVSLTLALTACAARVPAVVDVERARTPRGQITIVEFVDFECPFCRTMNDTLAPIVAEHARQIRVVRKQVPLTRFHPHAMSAALVSVCADALGKGDAVADALYRAPPSTLTLEGAIDVAARAGLDPSAVRNCTFDPQTDARVHDDTEAFFVGADGEGVPTIWIDDRVFVGVVNAETLRGAVERAIERAR